MAFTILHFSDPHLAHVTLNPTRWLGKSFLGMTNLLFRRRFIYSDAVFQRVIDWMLETPADMVVLTGDLTTTGQPEEFRKVQELLQPVRDHFPVVKVIPGNHDRYTAGVVRKRVFETYFDSAPFPTLDDLELNGVPIRVIGVETCRPTALTSSGKYVTGQTKAIEDMLCDDRAESRMRIILAHYPFAYPEPFSVRMGHGLKNRAQLISTLKSNPPAIYFHGHTHSAWAFRPGELDQTICINAGSASRVQRYGRPENAAGFNEVRVSDGKITVIRHYFMNDSRQTNIMFTGTVGTNARG